MKRYFIFILVLFLSCNLISQKKIEGFPMLSSFVDSSFQNTDNIFPIAFININIDSKDYKIPISYSLLHYTTDSSNFLNKTDNIDNYCFQLLDNGQCKPMFKAETLKLPTDWLQYLKKIRNNYDSIKTKIDLNNYFKFYKEANWWQNDATPKDEDGKPLYFICQIELEALTTDDCSLYIFFDKKKKIVRQIYQRD